MQALLCNMSAKSQIQVVTHDDLVARDKIMFTDAVDWIYENYPDFDRECFLIGTLDDDKGHYQTFTANKSIQEINEDVKWMFENATKFMPDTMACQRITTYKRGNINLPLFVVSLFKKDYPDLCALRVCTPDPDSRRYYGSEVKSVYDLEDMVCHKHFDIELFSSSLVKTVADYYNFDCEKAPLRIISSGGDIGYRGVINKEKIQTEAQKVSFLIGFFMRYEQLRLEPENDYYSILIPNSLSAAKVCTDILREFSCKQVDYIDKTTRLQTGHQIVYTPSNKTIKIKELTDQLQFVELLKGIVVF